MDNGAGVPLTASNVLRMMWSRHGSAPAQSHPRDEVAVNQVRRNSYSVSLAAAKTHLDLEADLHQHLEELQLFLQAHGHDQSLIAVAQIHTAPGRGLFNVYFFTQLS